MRIALLAIVLAVGCSASHGGENDAGADDTALYYSDVPRPDAYAGPVLARCGGTTCAEGQVCCLIDGRCVAPHDPSCAPPTSSPPGACATAADCGAGEVCLHLDARGNPERGSCGGVGTCWAVSITCGGGPGAGVCGCDGRTYDVVCDAYAAGVGIAASVACGMPTAAQGSCGPAGGACTHGTCDEVQGRCTPDDPLYACGADADCPSGQTCCTAHGVCIAPGDEGLCSPTPPGAVIGCTGDRDCERYDGTWWLPGDSMFCDGAGCTGPGGCITPPSSCDGTLAPVCGCDGRTYQNECEARRASVRVTHDGAC